MTEPFPSSMVIRPGRWLYVLAGFVFLAGLAAFGAFLFAFLSTIGEGYVRVGAPGTSEFALTEPGTYVIHHEFKSVLDGKIYSTAKGEGLNGLTLDLVALPDGRPVPLRQSSMSSTYSFGSYEGTSLMEFTAAAPGRFRLKAALEGVPDGAPRAVLSIAKESVTDILVSVFGGIAILFGSSFTAIAIVLVTFFKRQKAIKAAGVPSQ
ncbi:MAG TPA: hypothetical protein VLJ37_11885 [bacterium]|nr:hypothetical protein [bacterium]